MTLLSHADYERIAANLSYPTEAFIGGTFAPVCSLSPLLRLSAAYSSSNGRIPITRMLQEAQWITPPAAL